MRVLAVDDDLLVLVSPGLEALKELDRESVDLVVTDFMMPGMNGLELMLEGGFQPVQC